MSEDLTVFYARRKLFYDALRGPRFKQGTGTLTRYPGTPNEENCCLGVGCIVAGENGAPVPFRDVEDTRFYLSNAYRTEDETEGEDEINCFINSEDLPLAVKEWYGFDDHDPELTVVLHDSYEGVDYTAGVTASSLNDDKHFTFDQIADAFEAAYPCTREPEEPHGLLEP
jgi:hypothetical protein